MAEIRNPFEHHHGDDDHDHDHGHDHDLPPAELDPAQQSLAEALRVSFGILKLVMVVLVVLYALSGIVWGIPGDQVAVRLRFGQIVGATPEQAVLHAGRVYFAFPYPVDQVVFIPVKPQTIRLTRQFWFRPAPGQQEAQANLGQPGPLNPEQDGSLITGDGNITEAQWSVQYYIDKPLDFIRNVAAPAADPQAVLRSSDQVVTAVAEDAIIFAVAHITADEAATGVLRPALAKSRMQQLLDNMHTGIKINLVTCDEQAFPPDVREAFRAVSNAASEKARELEAATQQRTRVLNETAGAGYEPILAMIRQYEVARTADDTVQLKDLDAHFDWIFRHMEAPAWGAGQDATSSHLWQLLMRHDAAADQGDLAAATRTQQEYEDALKASGLPPDQQVMLPVGGEVAQELNEAKAYRTSVVASTRAQALAFNPRAFDPHTKAQGLLQQYESSPSVFLNRRWQDMLETVLSSDVDVFYLPPGQTYLELNRDPAVLKARETKALQEKSGSASSSSSSGEDTTGGASGP